MFRVFPFRRYKIWRFNRSPFFVYILVIRICNNFKLEIFSFFLLAFKNVILFLPVLNVNVFVGINSCGWAKLNFKFKEMVFLINLNPFPLNFIVVDWTVVVSMNIVTKLFKFLVTFVNVNILVFWLNAGLNCNFNMHDKLNELSIRKK